ncbi:MAG TPA: WYL domain-containing protein [Dehalococcoidia bacterium]|nr:WYL domain-containing protein [Dehalococcoidia bacterium]
MKTPSKVKQPAIELNEQFQRALDIMEHSGKNVFITGRAGTGKSTLLDYFRNTTKKKVVVLAPTGVAALNVRGQTIHSFFNLKPGITPEKVKRVGRDSYNSTYKELDAIVIDEISMVRADLLDCVDMFLRLNGPRKNRPFGGIQMIFVGDLYQLPPVVKGEEKQIFSSTYDTPYFFSAHVLHNLEMEFIELEKIYRQHDINFINLLNAIRSKSITKEDLALLNRRYFPQYEPSFDDFYVHLTTTNELADRINNRQLERLSGTTHVLKGKIRGQFGQEYLPTAIELRVKAGAQIMMLNNDAEGRWVNGTIGKIITIKDKGDNEPLIIATLSSGLEVKITPHKWEIYRFFIEAGSLQSEVVGTFRQYPIMLAWAVTIHKGQGKTFEKVIIDIGRGTFAHGQMYVALSRCTTLEGIVLKKPVRKHHVWMDHRIVSFLANFQYQKAEQACSVDEKIEIIKRAIRNNSALRIVYLKPNDEKSKRIVQPKEVGDMEYNGVKYTGLKAFCLKRNEERAFRVDRILEIEELPSGA